MTSGRCSTSRTTTAPPLRARRPGRARRRGDRPAARAARTLGRGGGPALRPRRRAARRAGRGRRRDGDGDVVARHVPGLLAGHALPLARDGRRPGLRVGQRRRGRPGGRPRCRRLRPLARPRRPRVAPVVGRLRDLPRPVRLERPRGRAAAVGGPARLGRAADRPRARDALRVVRRRPARGRAAARPRRAAGSERYLPDPGLPGRQHASLRRLGVRHGRPAARRRRGASPARAPASGAASASSAT